MPDRLPEEIDAHNKYRIYSNKGRDAYEIFRASNAALIRGRLLFKNWTRQRNLFFKFNGIFLSVRKFYSN